MSSDKNIFSKVSYSDTTDENAELGFLNQAARYVSNIFSPPLTVLYGVMIVTPYLELQARWTWSLLFVALFVLPPTLYVYILMQRGIITDFHIKVREQRIKPMLLILANTVFGILAYYRLGGPKYLVVLAVCCLLLVSIMFFFTFFSKISGHCAAAGGLLTVLMSIMEFNESAVIPIALMVPLIAWSRVRLGRHSVAQTLTGFILGVSTFGSILYFSDLI
jgi:membrane-associated phospholipid phosphatase